LAQKWISFFEQGTCKKKKMEEEEGKIWVKGPTPIGRKEVFGGGETQLQGKFLLRSFGIKKKTRPTKADQKKRVGRTKK